VCLLPQSLLVSCPFSKNFLGCWKPMLIYMLCLIFGLKPYGYHFLLPVFHLVTLAVVPFCSVIICKCLAGNLSLVAVFCKIRLYILNRWCSNCLFFNFLFFRFFYFNFLYFVSFLPPLTGFLPPARRHYPQ